MLLCISEDNKYDVITVKPEILGNISRCHACHG